MLRQVTLATLVSCAIIGASPANAQSSSPSKQPPIIDAGVCILDNESAQDLEKAGRLREARVKALSCSQGCPLEIARDCTVLAERIGPKVPTVIFGAKKDAQDLVDVTVSIDGQVMATKLDGKPIEIDTGARRVRFTTIGQSPIEVQIVFNAAEKNRLVIVEFGSVEGSTKPTLPENDTEGWSAPALFWILGGVSAASFVTAGVTGGLALSERGDLDACIATRTCDRADIDSVETKALVSDVFLGIGSGFAVGAVLVLFLWPEDEESVKPTVSVGTDHSFVGITSAF